MNLTSIEDAIEIAERRWPGLEFKRKNYEEASSACPFCREGRDRFLIFVEGNYWCRQCETKGSLKVKDPNHRLTEKELTDIRLKKLERQQAQLISRVTALERMHQCQDHITYHQQMDTADFDWWLTQGITEQTANDRLLGTCYRCPTDREARPSYTIPVFGRDGRTLLNIRHRLIGPNGQMTPKDKYRPHIAGLGLQLYNAHILGTVPEVTLVEGCKKALVCAQWLPTVGTMGKRAFKPEWLRWFDGMEAVNIALDPDAMDAAHRLGEVFRQHANVRQVRVCSFPTKPDDFFVDGGTVGEFQAFLHWGKPVKQ